MSGKKERKCIGVCIANPSAEYERSVLKGICRAAFENDMNTALFCSSSRSKDTSIFSLPNFDRLAGMIYVPYTFDYPGADEIIRPRLLDAVREKNFPAVTFDCKIDGIPCIMCDDSKTVGDVIEHIITEHKCKDIAYLTGSKGHAHAENRLKIFREKMLKYGLPILPGREYYGDFWYKAGDAFVDSLLNSEHGLPEAIICANSSMAFSVYKALYSRGLRIPTDVILAAYRDDTEMFPFISGATKEVEEAAYKAGCLLISMINGKKNEDEYITAQCGCKFSRSLSCGCVCADEYDLSKLVGTVVYNRDSYFSEYNRISADLLDRSSYVELFYGIDWYTLFLKNAAGIYFCMCEGWDKPDLKDERRTEYSERINLYYYRINNPDGTHNSVYRNKLVFPITEILPKIYDAEGEPSSYIFVSVNSLDKNFGYMAIDNGSVMQTYTSELDYWLRDVVNALEAQRRLQNMKFLYTSDLMTGIYNRNGFNNMMPEMIEKARTNGLQLFTALFDLNGMKFINDTYGHIEGDNSIKTAANIISDCTLDGAEEEKNFRIGGDEFIKAAVGSFTEADTEKLRSSIERHVTNFNKNSGKAYPIYISTGVCIKSPDEDYTLDSVIFEADKEMFIDKARIRMATGFDPKRKS